MNRYGGARLGVTALLTLAAVVILLGNVAAAADVSAPVPLPIPSPEAIRYYWTGNVLVALWLVHRSAGWVLRRFASRTGVQGLADIASLPLLVLILQGFALALSPIPLAVSRHMEHEADRFGLEITRDNYSCAMTFVKFVRHDLDYPTPGWLYQVWRSSHPPIGERIEFCNTYHPWRDGETERYGKYFKPAAR